MRLIDADALRKYFEVPHKLKCGIQAGMDEYALKCIDEQPTVASSPWRSVGEKPRDGQECIVAYLGPTDWIYEHATYHSDLNKALEEDIFIDETDGFIVDGDIGYARYSFNYWMPIEPPIGTERKEI